MNLLWNLIRLNSTKIKCALVKLVYWFTRLHLSWSLATGIWVEWWCCPGYPSPLKKVQYLCKVPSPANTPLALKDWEILARNSHSHYFLPCFPQWTWRCSIWMGDFQLLTRWWYLLWGYLWETNPKNSIMFKIRNGERNLLLFCNIYVLLSFFKCLEKEKMSNNSVTFRGKNACNVMRTTCSHSHVIQSLY